MNLLVGAVFASCSFDEKENVIITVEKIVLKNCVRSLKSVQLKQLTMKKRNDTTN